MARRHRIRPLRPRRGAGRPGRGGPDAGAQPHRHRRGALGPLAELPLGAPLRGRPVLARGVRRRRGGRLGARAGAGRVPRRVLRMGQRPLPGGARAGRGGAGRRRRGLPLQHERGPVARQLRGDRDHRGVRPSASSPSSWGWSSPTARSSRWSRPGSRSRRAACCSSTTTPPTSAAPRRAGSWPVTCAASKRRAGRWAPRGPRRLSPGSGGRDGVAGGRAVSGQGDRRC